MTGTNVSPPVQARTPQSAGPRFDLRLDAGEARLRLASPLVAGAFQVDSLDLDLGVIPGGIDLGAGFDRLRRRRTWLRSMEASVRLDVLAEAWRGEFGLDFEFAPASRDQGLHVALGSSEGVIAADLAFQIDGQDLKLMLEGVRASRDGAESPWKRFLDTARLLGLRFDERAGAFRWSSPVWRLLARSMVGHGWRVPELSRVVHTPPRWVDGALVFRSTAVNQRTEAETLDALRMAEESRAVAGSLAALAQGQTEVAYSALAEEVVRMREAGEAASEERLSRMAIALQGELGGREAQVLEQCGEDSLLRPEVRASLLARIHRRREDTEATVAATRDMLDVDPCSLLAVDAACVMAASLLEERPLVADDLLRRALARAPSSRKALMLRAQTAAAVKDPDILNRVGRLATRGHLRPRDLGRVYAAVGSAFLALGNQAEARIYLEQAEARAPDDVQVLEAHAELFLRDGDVARAVSHLDRAAEKLRGGGEPVEAARLLERGAEALVRGEARALAETRLERALELDPAAAAAAARLGQLRQAMGRAGAAADAFGALLPMTRRGDAWRDAMIAGARYHFYEQKDAEAAAPFVEGVSRAFPQHEEVMTLQLEMAAASADDWLERPGDLVAADRDLIARIARDASSPDEAVRAMLDAIRSPAARGEMVSSAINAARRGLVSGAIAAARRGKESTLMGRVASALVKLDMLPEDERQLEELAGHAGDDAVRELIEAAQGKLEE